MLADDLDQLALTDTDQSAAMKGIPKNRDARAGQGSPAIFDNLKLLKM